MSGDYDSLREIGGSQLAQHYPDRGLLADVDWYEAGLSVETAAVGWLGALRKLSSGTNCFWAVLSANGDGFRIFSAMEQFAVFIPWAESAVTAERAVPATVVRLRTSAVPALTLVFHLDDDAADDLFRAVIAPLPRRDPPRRLFHFKAWAMGVLVIAILVVALASLQLSALTLVVAVVVAAAALWLVLLAFEPVIEEQR